MVKLKQSFIGDGLLGRGEQRTRQEDGQSNSTQTWQTATEQNHLLSQEEPQVSNFQNLMQTRSYNDSTMSDLRGTTANAEDQEMVDFLFQQYQRESNVGKMNELKPKIQCNATQDQETFRPKLQINLKPITSIKDRYEEGLR